MDNGIVKYQTPDGGAIELRQDGSGDYWFTVDEIAAGCGCARPTVAEHIQNVFAEEELEEGATCRDFRQVQIEGGRNVTRTVKLYHEDVVCAVGFRVKTEWGKRFRQALIKLRRQTRKQPLEVAPAIRQYIDRVGLQHVPAGYFAIVKECADLILALAKEGYDIPLDFQPDISVGEFWSRCWLDRNLAAVHGDRIKYRHFYPDYNRQAVNNPYLAFAYPETSWHVFQKWFREDYKPVHLTKR